MYKKHLKNLNRTRAVVHSDRNDGLYLDRNERVENYSKDEVYDHRKTKFLQIGREQGFTKSSNLEGGLSYKESSLEKLKTHIDKNKFAYAGIGLIAITSLIVLLF